MGGAESQSVAGKKGGDTLDVKESKYVTDKLRLSLYKKADSNSGTIKLLVSGDRLDVLERSGPYSRVRTKQGEVGWVKNGFLVNTPTSSYLLLAEQQKNEQLSQQLDKYANTEKLMQDYENTIQQLQQNNEKLLQELQLSKQASEGLTGQIHELQKQIDMISEPEYGLTIEQIMLLIYQYWYFALSILLMMFVSGLFIGRKMIKAQVNRRFQGVKVL